MEKNDVMLSHENKESQNFDKESQNSDKETQNSDQETIISGGYIGSSDFITWTAVAVVGIAFCFIHAYQDYFYQWIGTTSETAQSYQAKVVVSIMSTIIGSCGITIMMKAIVGATYTMMKYRGISFCKLVTLIGGYLPSHIPLLVNSDGWPTIILILVILAISVASKQLAVVSMSVCYFSKPATLQSFTPNYTTCNGITSGAAIEGVYTSMTLNIYNSLINRNSSHTNESYDKGIPETLLGKSTFERVLPYTNVSCGEPFNSSNLYFDKATPSILNNLSTWETILTISLNDEIPMDYTEPSLHTWMNCSIISGYANAISSCNTTCCLTKKTSDITPYNTSGFGVPFLLERTLDLLYSNSDYKNPLMTWLMGGKLTDTYLKNYSLPERDPEMIKRRVQILGTASTRILCDYNDGVGQESTTPITSRYKAGGYFQYRVLWKWPFYFFAGFIFISWLICMFTLWITPESRIISVEWLLSQYISKNQLSYLSGRQLIQAHEGSVFQVTDETPDTCVGSIIISRTSYYNNVKKDKIIHKKQYQ